ncbi:MAG: trypsin-like peptidase domain-containing protein [Planctomycetota bacterium]
MPNYRRTLLLGALGLCLAAVAPAQEGAPPAAARYPDFRQIVQDAKTRVFPAVVYIKCVRETHEQGKKESQQVSGSGVIVSPEGGVLTNWHVIDKAEDIRCLLSDGRHAKAEVVGSDQDTDLALIRLKFDQQQPDLPYASLGDSTTLKEGDFVMAMGAPWGLNRSVSIGIVSCTTRYLDQVSEYSLWIQTDAAINPGNSGGPLINTVGEVIGLNARGINYSDGMGFAIPSETIASLLPQLRAHGKVSWSWTGLQLQPLRDFNRDMYFDATAGVIVAGTDPDSPARRVGFLPKDRIISVAERPVTALTEEDLPALRRWLGLLPKGQPVTFAIARGEDRLNLELTPREKGEVEGQEYALERFDFTVKEINQFDNPDLYFHRQQGLFVFGVKYPGNASDAGLQPKDIILKIDTQEQKTIDDLKTAHRAALENIQSRHRLVFTVLRNGLMRQIVLDFARDYEKE